MIKAVIFDMFETLITHYDSPLYFGTQIAKDAGIDVDTFRKPWREAETERASGKITLQRLLENILKENGKYSDELLSSIVQKRIRAKEETFDHMHGEILPMLSALKEKGIKIALISNCYDEEMYVIKNSIIYGYFDVICFSFKEGVMKPDKDIYLRCLKRLGVSANECLYIGDGGSDELEAAKDLGFKPFQAVWYLKKHDYEPTGIKKGFIQLESPLEIMGLI